MLTFFTIKFILVVVVFALSLGVAAYSTWGERKFAAVLQDRIGPDRAGPFGLLQPLADGLKMFMKEEFIPSDANKWLFILGPSLFMMTACMTGVVIPWTSPIQYDGQTYAMQISDINIGVLYVLGVASIGVYGIMIGGWSSNNKFALMGSLRASSQMISYEIALGLAVVAIVMMTGELSLGAIVEKQANGGYWNILKQPLGFVIYLVCAFAECNRAPFDLPETESELVGGYHTEYTSMKLGFFLFAEYINMFISSALIVSLYFGGYHLPYISDLGLGPNLMAFIHFGIFMTKVVFFILFYMWVRWTLPRFRFDQLMNLGWKALLPLALVNIMLTAGVMYFLGLVK